MGDSTWRLAGYVVQQQVGSGGSGQVWLARVRSTGEPVALKRIAVRDHAGLLAARSEAAILGALEHRHLIRLRDCVVDCHGVDRAVVLVLELAAGGSLAALLDRRGRLTCGEAVTALAPIGAALAYAHGAGIVHGDVTPANILFTESGIPMLADLGVARVRGELTSVCSTPAYLDPMVAAGDVPTAASDVFMLGAVALQVLTGTPIWSGSSAEDLLAAARVGDLSDVPSRLARADVPEPVAAVLVRALAPDPAQRGTAADFALDLRHSCDPTAVELTAGRAADPERRPAPTYGIGPSTRAPLPRSLTAAGDGRRRRISRRPNVRRRPIVLAGAGCALAAVLGAVVLTWPRGGSGGSPGPNGSGGGSVVPIRPGGPAGLPTPFTPPMSRGPAAPTDVVPAALDSTSAASVLLRLDGTRAKAFADRDATLLTGVYAPGPLLAQDTALLKKIIPVGCGLNGVHTRYGAVELAGRNGARVTVRASTELARSTLVCAGRPVAEAAGGRPTTLHITLVRSGAAYLIGDITR